MSQYLYSGGRAPFTLTFALAWAAPAPAFATSPEQTTGPAVAPAEPSTQPQQQQQPDPDPATQPPAAPAPVYEPQPQPVPPQPVPPSANRNRNRGLGLMIAGLSTFAASYAISALVAGLLIDWSNPKVGRPLLIPVVGPWIGIARSVEAEPRPVLAIMGAAQLAGLGMAIGGGVWWGRSRRQAQLSFTPGGLRLRF